MTIICIDESNIRADALNGKKWEFKPKIQRHERSRDEKVIRKKISKTLNILNADRSLLTYGN